MVTDSETHNGEPIGNYHRSF